jgi:hypothetical protein
MRVVRNLMPVLCACVLIGAPANANIILFSNLVQSGNQYGPDGVGIGHTPAFPNAGDYLIYAVPFVPSATAVLRSFLAPLAVANGTNQLQAFFMGDSAGQPGSVLESFSLSNLPTAPGPLSPIESALDPLVVAGQRYWFGVTGGPQTFGIWTLNLSQGNPTDGGASRTVVNGVAQPWIVGSGSRTGALQVSGNPVPEPAYTTPLCSIVILLALIRLRRSAIFLKKESANGAQQTQTAERGHRTL